MWRPAVVGRGWEMAALVFLPTVSGDMPHWTSRLRWSAAAEVVVVALRVAALWQLQSAETASRIVVGPQTQCSREQMAEEPACRRGGHAGVGPRAGP